MKKPRAVIKVNGEEVLMDGFYRSFENLKHVEVCIEDNRVVSVENISEDMDVHIKNDTYIVLSPGSKVSFGSLKRRPTLEELKLTYRSHQGLNYEDTEHFED